MARMRDLTKTKLNELTMCEIDGLARMLGFTAEEVHRYFFTKVPSDSQTENPDLVDAVNYLMSDITAMMEQMDLIDLVQLRDVAREMTKKEGLPAGTSEAL